MTLINIISMISVLFSLFISFRSKKDEVRGGLRKIVYEGPSQAVLLENYYSGKEIEKMKWS
jgi:hypothetical protein